MATIKTHKSHYAERGFSICGTKYYPFFALTETAWVMAENKCLKCSQILNKRMKPLFENGTQVKAIMILGESGYIGVVIENKGNSYLVDHGSGIQPIWYPDYSLTKVRNIKTVRHKLRQEFRTPFV